jgi:hypothetical protein
LSRTRINYCSIAVKKGPLSFRSSEPLCSKVQAPISDGGRQGGYSKAGDLIQTQSLCQGLVTCDKVGEWEEMRRIHYDRKVCRSLKAMTRWITHEASGRVLKTVVVWGWDWGRGVKNGGLKGVDQRDEDQGSRTLMRCLELVG